MPALPTDSRPCTDLPLVLVSWDGDDLPLRMVHLDTTPQFRFLVFDYTGRCQDERLQVAGVDCSVMAHKTECKGDIYQIMAAHLEALEVWPEYVALIDDDILLSISDINRLLHVARVAALDSFAPVLAHDCHWGHRWTLRQGDRLLLPVDWVEVMMPFYRTPLFMAGRELYEGRISSYGIDKYAMTTVQKLTGMDHVALVNGVVASHMRPISTGAGRRYRNGLTGDEEKAQLREQCMALVRRLAPDLKDSAWWRRTFEQRHVRSFGQRMLAGLGRPIRHWLERAT
ncbi:MAG: hypothetical protein QM788_13305 [Roseateles sp.]|uniref:hypothetical protein n=1 Tax=Roseateles sp. TaxID=1971397 RepID=UPI0039EC8178